MMSLRQAAIFSVVVFSLLSILLFVQHEIHITQKLPTLPNAKSLEIRRRGKRGNNAKIEKTIKEMVAILNDLRHQKDSSAEMDKYADDEKSEEDEEANSEANIEAAESLEDKHDQCEAWAGKDPSECTVNPTFMLSQCAKSCQLLGYALPLDEGEGSDVEESTEGEIEGEGDVEGGGEVEGEGESAEESEEPEDGEEPTDSSEGGDEGASETAAEEEGGDGESKDDGSEEDSEAANDGTDDKFEAAVGGPEIDYYKNHEEEYEGPTVDSEGSSNEETADTEVSEYSDPRPAGGESLVSGGKGGANDDTEPIVIIQENDGHLSGPKDALVDMLEQDGEDSEDPEDDSIDQSEEAKADDDAEKGELQEEGLEEVVEEGVEVEDAVEEVEEEVEGVEVAIEEGKADAEIQNTQSSASRESTTIPAGPTGARGSLTCNGKDTDSEIIYWKVVPGDAEYESPITPHHENHHDRYLTFEYDNGGWNNIRMGLECLVVAAHAMGRTLVVPPQQHLYLLGKTHQDKEDAKAHDEMGFEDIFETSLLHAQTGMTVMHMEDFLAKEGVTGGLHGQLPPKNSTEAWGRVLWAYLDKVADVNPAWSGRYLAFPSHAGDFELSQHKDPKVLARLKEFGGERLPVFYDKKLQQAHHIHFPGDDAHRLLQHHYAFAFFADPSMQTFYKRFVRDYLRYKDNIQCSGHELVAMVREDAKHSVANNPNGDYYALHVRRGDFQFKDVKISADEIVKNLISPNGSPLIPRGALVYLSTDDPDGVCKNCIAMRKPCESYKVSERPTGCPWPTSWKAFEDAGWKIRFLHDYQKKGALKGVNPNLFGMVESIVCSRAKVFAGTYFSTFTGYIHRLRGYHGLGEATYYHSKHYFQHPQMKKSVGHGFSREWRAGWQTDDGGSI